MRLPALLLFLVILLSSSFAQDAEAHVAAAGTDLSVKHDVDRADTLSGDGPEQPCYELDCCFVCLSPGLPGPADSLLSDDIFSVVLRARFGEFLTDGLSHAPPIRPPIPA